MAVEYYTIQDTTLQEIIGAIKTKTNSSDGVKITDVPNMIMNLDIDISEIVNIVSDNIVAFLNERITTVPDYLFYKSANLESINLPNVTRLGYQSFWGCSKLNSLNLPLLQSIDMYAFRNCTSIIEIDLPLVTGLGSSVFQGCTNLTSVTIPQAISIVQSAFADCSSLTLLNAPKVTKIQDNPFLNCSKLSKLDLPMLSTIGNAAFYNCTGLNALIIRTNSLCTLSSTSAFTNTPIVAGTGYIYVPSNLVDTYKTASNWSTYANQIRAIEDYPEICGTNSATE